MGLFKTRLAQLIAQEEGFGIPHTIPTLRHNPGDLRHAPHASHTGISPEGIGIEPSDELGAEDLERQLFLYAARGLTLTSMVAEYAPPCENNSSQYLTFLCTGLGLPATTQVIDALQIPPMEEEIGHGNIQHPSK